jgi:two-component system response regulator HydG
MRPKILIADDEPSLRLMLRANLKADYDVFEVEDGLQAVMAVRQQFFDLVLMDIRMPGLDGLDALVQIKQISPGIVVFLMTAYESLETARTAVQRGASDYISKPVDVEELKAKINRLLEYRTLQRENIILKERLGEQFADSNIIARSPIMREVLENVALIAPTDATVLILGESGTGKELIANLIHERSSRASGPFVKLNCAAITETLLESELFGHERGSFTGATARKEGRFELADGGSFLLDEIGEMSSTTQTKLLRVLQEQQFERVGGTESISVDVRIIAVTNKDLEAEVKEGRFREDLYYRLNVVPICLPPLRERREDIPLLAESFLKHYAAKDHRDVERILPEALDMLMRHDWPGELLTPEELPTAIRQSAQSTHGMAIGSLKEIEQECISRTLAQVGGNRTQAAKILGITRKTLQNKIKRYSHQQ